MAGQTPRFNLNYFGGDTPGDFDDDADKYTGEDRLVIDRLLSVFEQHTHRVPSRIGEPTEVPDAELNTSVQGALEAGATYYYVVSFVNADGLETVCGPEASVDMPDELDAPEAPQGSTTTGGNLEPGLYYYALSGLRDPEESALSDVSAFTILDNDLEKTVLLDLPDLGDATELQVWRMKDDDPGWTRIGTSATTTFTDDGTVPAGAYGDPANDPPLVATGLDNYAVTITLTGDDVTDAQNATSWRIYRSDTSGVYSAASLVHEVVERTNELDPTTPLLTSWIDDGDAILTGTPKVFDQQLQIPPFTFETQDGLPDPARYPEYYPLVDASSQTLYMIVDGAWSSINPNAPGSQGPTGPSGPAGATGPAGPSGPPGTGGSGSSMRGRAVFTGHGYPNDNPEGALADDIYIDLDDGEIYALDGPPLQVENQVYGDSGFSITTTRDNQLIFLFLGQKGGTDGALSVDGSTSTIALGNSGAGGVDWKVSSLAFSAATAGQHVIAYTGAGTVRATAVTLTKDISAGANPYFATNATTDYLTVNGIVPLGSGGIYLFAGWVSGVLAGDGFDFGATVGGEPYNVIQRVPLDFFTNGNNTGSNALALGVLSPAPSFTGNVDATLSRTSGTPGTGFIVLNVL